MLIQNDSLINAVLKNTDYPLEEHWDRLEEPFLHEKGVESYRLSVIVLLYDFLKVYRAEKRWNNYTLFVKEFVISTTVKFREDSLVNTFQKEITAEQWASIQTGFQENCFWTMPFDIEEDNYYLDSSHWLLEARNGKNNCTTANYHLANRNSPSDTTKFSHICELFFALDSLNVRAF
ncbi:MAG: hypothetical protein AAGI23_19365 [Bacteroidota bacterium]